MATLNATNSTNNGNTVLWGWSTKLVWHTDRKVSTAARGGVVHTVENLGVGVTTGDLFTLLT